MSRPAYMQSPSRPAKCDGSPELLAAVLTAVALGCAHAPPRKPLPGSARLFGENPYVNATKPCNPSPLPSSSRHSRPGGTQSQPQKHNGNPPNVLLPRMRHAKRGRMSPRPLSSKRPSCTVESGFCNPELTLGRGELFPTTCGRHTRSGQRDRFPL